MGLWKQLSRLWKRSGKQSDTELESMDDSEQERQIEESEKQKVS